jgi:hypothetical protein
MVIFGNQRRLRAALFSLFRRSGVKFNHLLIATFVLVAACGKEQATQPVVETEAESASPVAVQASGGNPAAEEASRQITDEYMRGIIVEISDDAYEGRGPGAPGDVKARKYLAEQMEKLGLQPGAADGGWEQPFDLVGVNASQPATWTFEGHGQSKTLKQWDEFIIGSGVQAERA